MEDLATLLFAFILDSNHHLIGLINQVSSRSEHCGRPEEETKKNKRINAMVAKSQ